MTTNQTILDTIKILQEEHKNTKADRLYVKTDYTEKVKVSREEIVQFLVDIKEILKSANRKEY